MRCLFRLYLGLLLWPSLLAHGAIKARTPFAQKIAQEIPLLLDQPSRLRISLQERLKDPSLLAEDRQALTVTLLYLGLATEDIDLAQDTLAALRPLVQDQSLAYGYLLALETQNQALIERDTNNYANLKQAEGLARAHQDGDLLIYVLGLQAEEATNSFRPHVALQKLQEAEDILRQQPQDDWTLAERQIILSYYDQVGDRRDLVRSSLLEILDIIHGHAAYRYFRHVLYFNLALGYFRQGEQQAQASLNHLEQALRWARSIDDSYGMALTYQAMAMVHQGVGRVDEALDSAREAQKRMDTLNLPHRRFWNSMVMAELYMVKQEADMAESYARDAKKWLDQSKYQRDEYPYLEFIANLAEQKLQHKKAAELWRELYFRRYDSIEESDRRLSQKLSAEFELQNLEHKNSLQKSKLETQARQNIALLLGLLCLGLIIIVLTRSRFKDRIIKKQKERIQGILDSIHEGILRTDQDGQIEADHSKQLVSLLQEGENLSRRSLFSCLIEPSGLSEDEKNRIQQTLQALLNEDELAWDLNAAQLPNRLPFKSKILQVSWQPVLSASRRIKGLQLVIRDDSAEEQLKQEILKERSRQNFLQTLWQELSSRHFAQAVTCIQEVRRVLGSLSLQAPSLEEKRLWHTLKGNARSLGLKSLAAEIHLIEDGIRSQERYPESLLQALDSLLKAYESLFASLNVPAKSADDSVPALCHRITEDMKQRYPQLWGRPLRLEFVDSWQDWSPELLKDVGDVLTHGLNNAMDHGYMRPEAAGEKPRDLVFTMETLRSDHGLVLRILDEGAGINWKALEALAHKKLWTYQNREELVLLLWQDEVSTASDVSLSSGRGMGLAAIKSLVDSRQGEVKLHDRQDGRQGSCLQVFLPMDGATNSAPSKAG